MWTPLLLCGLAMTVPALLTLEHRQAGASAAIPADARDGQQDFDFEFGTWQVRLSRLDRPLSGSTTWIDYEGTSAVRKVWDGRANLGELAVKGPGGEIRGLSLRLYDPKARQWHISWANARDGLLGDSMTGGFSDGRGEFFGEEVFDGRVILVRFVFSGITPRAFQFEQAFSPDWGRTWEVNWKATFRR